MFRLEILNGLAAGKIIDVISMPFQIGRAATNQLELSDYHLSSNHVSLVQEGETVFCRDLRSTNGTAVVRRGERTQLDASADFQAALYDGDLLELGDPEHPVQIKFHRLQPAYPRFSSTDDGLADGTVDDDEGSLIASRSIIELSKVVTRVDDDPATALRTYKAFAPLSTKVELQETVEGVADAAFALFARATHVSILTRHDADKDRFTLALSKSRGGKPHLMAAVQDSGSTNIPAIRASRSILRRVLADRVAVLTANAPEEISASDSILSSRMLSIMAIPMWRGDAITGVIQIDNRDSAGMFSEKDLEVALLLGAQAALAIANAQLVKRLRIAEEKLSGENRYLKSREATRFPNIIGEAKSMKHVLSQLSKVIDTRATVCILGETGTGKELIASAIHYQSQRRDKLFVAQNCAALPENLLESELYGHKKGAFTSADSDKKGLFEIADGGTLFLDEVGEMPLSLQAKLLRTLQEGTIRPVGATAEKQVDVRILCATNRNLKHEVERGTFRQDLFYRLMVFPIELPPLRERADDVPELAAHFLHKYGQEYRREVAGFSQEALEVMASYSWPGNIRELENEVQRLVIQADQGAWIETSHLSPQVRRVDHTMSRVAPQKGTLKEMMDQVERWLLAEALRENEGNKTKTAQQLGITREGLHKKLGKIGM